ncbi:MAG: ABC transporter permease, partial [Rubrivivax sp.]
MRSVPLSYIMRNLWVRRFTTILTAGGMALVVFVFAAVLMMSEGINETLVSTGQPDNVMVLRKGAGSEINSVITREQASAIANVPGVATDALGRKLVSKEPVVLNNLPKVGTGGLSNVPVRGTSDLGMRLRPKVKIIQGQMFRAGTSELIIGQAIARGFQNTGLGQTLHFAGRDWVIVGIFDAGRSGFDSEIWGDSDQVLQAYHRAVYSSVIFKLADRDSFPVARETIASDPRLSLDVKREQQFYAEKGFQPPKRCRNCRQAAKAGGGSQGRTGG